MTPTLGATGACASVPGVTPLTTDRCITSVGTANGVKRRVQMRSSTKLSFMDFSRAGLVGESVVYAKNSGKFTSDIGTNGHVDFGNSVDVYTSSGARPPGKVMIAPGGTYSYGSSINVQGGTQTDAVPFVLPQAEFEFPEATNNNAALPSSVFNQTTRVFNIASGEYTLPPGTYHFCSVDLGNSVKLKMSSTTRTRIYIDSPSRSGTVCAAGTGTFFARNSVEINKEVGEREELLEMIMYGTGLEANAGLPTPGARSRRRTLTGECRSDFMLDNSSLFYGTIYAPNSTVQAKNSAKFYGAIAAEGVRFCNSAEFFFTPEVRNKGALIVGATDRKAWRECRSAPTVPTDPESGC